MLIELFKILRYAWPFLKELFFGEGTVLESVKRHWIIWGMAAVNLSMFLIILFLGTQGTNEAALIEKARTENDSNLKVIMDLKQQVDKENLSIQQLQLQVNDLKNQTVVQHPPPVKHHVTPGVRKKPHLKDQPKSDSLTQALNTIK